MRILNSKKKKEKKKCAFWIPSNILIKDIGSLRYFVEGTDAFLSWLSCFYRRYTTLHMKNQNVFQHWWGMQWQRKKKSMMCIFILLVISQNIHFRCTWLYISISVMFVKVRLIILPEIGLFLTVSYLKIIVAFFFFFFT